MKRFISLFFLIFILVSCGEESVDKQQELGGEKNSTVSEARVQSGTSGTGSVKKGVDTAKASGSGAQAEGRGTAGKGGGTSDFFIETKKTTDFQSISSIEKIGKVVPSQSIELKSQVSGKLSAIYVKQGQSVSSGQKIAQLSDSYSKYGLSLEKTKIDLDKQYISKDTQIISLDQKIADSKISLEDAKKLYDNAVITYTSEKENAELTLENSILTANSDKEKSIIEFEKAQLKGVDTEANLELNKANLDYENTLNENAQQLQTYVENIKKEYDNLYLDLGDIIRFGDEILGITSNYKNEASKIRQFVGTKDSVTKEQTIELLNNLINYKEELDLYNIETINKDNMLESMKGFSDGYLKISLFLNSMEKTLENSISSIGILSQGEIDGYISQTNSFQNSIQGNNSSFKNAQNSINTFLNTYKQSELSALKNVELQKNKLESGEQTTGVNHNTTLSTLDNKIKEYNTHINKHLLILIIHLILQEQNGIKHNRNMIMLLKIKQGLLEV